VNITPWFPKRFLSGLSRMSANTRLDSLSDLAKHKANLRVRCPECHAENVFDAARFNRFALLKGWNSQLGALAHHIRCRTCKRRGPYLSATPAPPTLADPFPRSEDGWKQLHRRMRGLRSREQRARFQCKCRARCRRRQGCPEGKSAWRRHALK
jgi:hypothetical protein